MRIKRISRDFVKVRSHIRDVDPTPKVKKKKVRSYYRKKKSR